MEGAEESDTDQVTKSFGIMKMDNNKSYYISDAQWLGRFDFLNLRIHLLLVR
jgi:hypothetical protein